VKNSVVSLSHHSARRLVHRKQNTNIFPQSTGFPELDDYLPGGGWPSGQLIEIFTNQKGIGELSLLRSALGALSHQRRWLAWVAPPIAPCGLTLSVWGINLAAVLIVHPRRGMDTLGAATQGLTSGMYSAVLVWSSRITLQQLHRLELAAKKNDASVFLFRPIDAIADPSPAKLQLSVTREHHLLTVTLLKGWRDDARKDYGLSCSNPMLKLSINHAIGRNSVA
jgi:cell division inhibitor SulA